MHDGDGWIVGKPAYMAPEQLERSAVDERADIYAVGAVLFQTITGTLHRGEIEPGAVQVPTQVLPEARAALERTAPRELAEVVLRALSPEPEGRYADAREMARAIEQLVETGQKIATADELAEAVSAMVQTRPAQTKSVLLLSGADDGCFSSGTELTRVGDGDSEDKHGFTLKIRDVPPVAAPPATTTVDDDELLMRPRRRRWIGAGFLGLALVIIGIAILSRGPTDASIRTESAARGASERVALPPDQPVAGAASASTAGPAAGRAATENPAAERPVVKSGSSAGSASSRKGDAHARAKDLAAKEAPTRDVPAAPAQSSTCRGQLHLYATHGWLLSGGPGSVQAPGRYDWPCGTFGLKAVSRLDSSDVRSVTVTIREGTPGIVDLR
jgi:hypothetical protein